MKIIQKDESIKEEEDAAKAYYSEKRNDPLFQKYIIDMLLLPYLRPLTDLRWFYNDVDKLVSSSDKEIAAIIRNNSINYSVLLKFLSPIISEDRKEKL